MGRDWILDKRHRPVEDRRIGEDSSKNLDDILGDRSENREVSIRSIFRPETIGGMASDVHIASAVRGLSSVPVWIFGGQSSLDDRYVHSGKSGEYSGVDRSGKHESGNDQKRDVGGFAEKTSVEPRDECGGEEEVRWVGAVVQC